MVDFYIVLGFVPRSKYDEMLTENEKLKEENRFLRDTIRELQVNIFREGGEKVQQAWGTIIDKQLEMNKEIAKNFVELFKQLRNNSQ
jgi:FtsZ-binding cell division protein ZapB